MAKWDGLLKKKSAYLIIGIAIICLILGPILGTLLNKAIVIERKPQIIHDDSTSGIAQAFAQKVTLAKDQKLTIQISEFYPNCSVTVIIVLKSTYLSAIATTDPVDLTPKLEFVYSEFGWGTTPGTSTSGATSLSLSSASPYYYIEFMGDRSGDALISWPGDYYVIVYGTNSGVIETEVKFDITIAVDGPGELLFNIFVLAGVFLLIFYFIAAVIVILRKNYFR